MTGLNLAVNTKKFEHMSAKKIISCTFFIVLTLMVDTVLGSALSPFSVNMVMLTVTGAISYVIANVYTNGSVYTNVCYKAHLMSSQPLFVLRG